MSVCDPHPLGALEAVAMCDRHLSYNYSFTISFWWPGMMTNDYDPFHAIQGPRWESRRQRGPFTLTQQLFKILISALNWTICVRFVISSYRTRGDNVWDKVEVHFVNNTGDNTVRSFWIWVWIFSAEGTIMDRTEIFYLHFINNFISLFLHRGERNAASVLYWILWT